MHDNTFDLAGRDRSRPLSEMIDMPAYLKSRQRRRRESARATQRAGFRRAILCIAALPLYVAFVYATPDSLWTEADQYSMQLLHFLAAGIGIR
jgi:hypothetical protein